MKAARFLIIVFALFALATLPSAAAPQTSPCTLGTAYDPACDVNHDNQMTIADIQLTAGHWNQSGAWVSDNNHTHLGQTWTGSNNPLKLTGSYSQPDYAALVLSNSTFEGLRITLAGGDGIILSSAGGDGLWMNSVGNDGVSVSSAGRNGITVGAAGDDGVYVGSVDDAGLYISRADGDGVRIRSAGDDGIQIGEGGNYSNYGLYIPSPGVPQDGLWPNTANAAGQWALYTVDNIEAGNVFLSAQTLVAIVGGDQPLVAGDVVAAAGLADPIPGSFNRLAQVGLATADQANVVGVVTSRMALRSLPGKDGEQELRSTDGPALPGDYVAITVLGAAQVKVQDEPAVQLGQRLTVAETPGQARAMRIVEVEGIQIDESGPTLGVALEPAKDGLVWVLVNPQ